MIYDYPERSEAIRQGDIFTGLPRIDLSLDDVVVVGETGESVARWADIVPRNEPVTIIVPARPVAAIVATQDCDAMRARDITLCEIGRFLEVERKANENTGPKGWKNILTQHARINLKWFYLPPDDTIGFQEKMAVDFMMTLRLPRAGLENLRYLRRGRLNPLAYEHFRERMAEFFRRYPYDEWYPLSEQEMVEYRKEYPAAKPYPWQRTVLDGPWAGSGLPT